LVPAALIGLAAAVYVLAFGSAWAIDSDRTAAGDTVSAMAGDALSERHDLLFGASLLHVTTAASLGLLALAFGAQALRRGGRPAAAMAVFVVVGCFVSGELVKWGLHVLEPLDEATGHAAAESFPSVHTAVAATLALGLALLAPARWRVPALLLGIAYPAAMGLIAVMLGWHFPSDVIAGLLFGGAWIAAFPVRARAGSVGWDRLLLLVVRLGLAGAVVPCLAIAAAAAMELGDDEKLSGPLVAGVGAIVATACVTSLIAACAQRQPVRRVG
jgi:membrane-associated phospholipid phosphatase